MNGLNVFTLISEKRKGELFLITWADFTHSALFFPQWKLAQHVTVLLPQPRSRVPSQMAPAGFIG